MVEAALGTMIDVAGGLAVEAIERGLAKAARSSGCPLTALCSKF